jgi:anti-sigma B factor antagonist
MEYTEKIDDGVVLISLRGPFLAEPDAITLRKHIYKLVEDHITGIVMDLGDVTHINSCGLGLLVSVLTTLKRRGGQLRLSRMRENVRSVFSVTGLVMIFELSESTEEALKSVRLPGSK